MKALREWGFLVRVSNCYLWPTSFLFSSQKPLRAILGVLLYICFRVYFSSLSSWTA